MTVYTLPRDLMMVRFILLLSGALVLGCGGRSSQPFTDNSQDPELLARNIKQLVVNEVSDARKSRDPYDHLRVIYTSIPEPGARKPIGDYGDVYTRISTLAESLTEATERANGPTPDLQKKLDQLLAIADELPGDSQPSIEPRF